MPLLDSMWHRGQQETEEQGMICSKGPFSTNSTSDAAFMWHALIKTCIDTVTVSMQVLSHSEILRVELLKSDIQYCLFQTNQTRQDSQQHDKDLTDITK